MSYASERVKAWRVRTRSRLMEAFGGSCCACGQRRHPYCYDFHHLDPAGKDCSMGDMRADIKSWGAILDEVRKCVLLCKCCHIEVHAGVLQVPADAPRFDESKADYMALARAALYDECPECGNPKPIRATVCSPACAARHRRKVDWGAVDIPALRAAGLSWVAIGSKLGVSDTAVRKYLRKSDPSCGGW